MNKVIDRLQQAWLALKGELHENMVIELQAELQRAFIMLDKQTARANEAARLYNEGEIGRKAASDALGEKAILDLKSKPWGYP